MSVTSTRTGRFVRGLSLGYVNMAVALVVGLWLTPFMIGHLGQSEFGVWLMIGQALTYLGLVDLGVVALLPRETAYAVGRAGSVERAVDIPDIVGQTIRVVLWQVPLVALIAALAFVFLPTYVHGATGPLAWLLVIFVVRFPIRIYQEILVGLQDLAFVGKLQLVGFLFSTASTVVLVIVGWGLYSLVVGWGVGQIVPALASWWRLRRRFPGVLPRSLPRLSTTMAARQFAKGGWISVAQLAHLMVYGTDVLILGNLLGPAAVVPYVCTGKLVSVLQNQPQMVMEIARPALSELKAGENPARLHGVSSALTLASLLLGGLIACGIAATNRGFTSLWVGDEFFGGAALTLALVVNMLLRLWNVTAINAIFAFGYEKRISLTTLADGLLTAGMTLAIVPTFGPVGAPLASIISVTIVSLPANLSALAKEGGVSLVRQVAGLSAWFARFVLVFATVIWAERLLEPRTLQAVAISAVSVTIVYCLVMLPIGKQPPLAQYTDPLAAGIRTRFAAWRNTGGASE